MNGSITTPDEFHPLFNAWEQGNNVVHNWLMHSISPAIARSVEVLELASDVWEDLKERFSRPDMVKAGELLEEFYALRQGSLTVTGYYSKLKAVWEEIENYRLIPTCTCPVQYSCEAMRNARLFKKQEYVLRFLVGLGDQFSQVKMSIEYVDIFPSMNHVFSMILQQESKMSARFQDE